ncbi:MAG: hypothetical protein WC794_01295 [Candidatus Doudnabacteria bacterium]|jgi:hypothetical protein
MKNLDGISKIKFKTPKPIVKVKKQPRAEVFYSGFLVPPRLGGKRPALSFRLKIRQQAGVVSGVLINKLAQAKEEFKKFNSLKKAVPVYAIIVALSLAFGGGAWAALNTQKTSAQDFEQTQAGPVPFVVTGNLGPIGNVSNDTLFNMTIGQLENYLNSIAEQNRAEKAAEIMANRKIKLHAYLSAKNSSFADVSDIIAEQKHWKLILAISFAESTFGRNCVDNNCSNIGVKPGHPYWHKYATLGDWVKDFNKLLERRYSDWTLEEMNGVYVQPKNPNWMQATRQVLEDLQELGIE